MAARMEPGTCLRNYSAQGFVNCRSTASRPVMPDNRAMTQRRQHSEPDRSLRCAGATDEGGLFHFPWKGRKPGRSWDNLIFPVRSLCFLAFLY